MLSVAYKDYDAQNDEEFVNVNTFEFMKIEDGYTFLYKAWNDKEKSFTVAIPNQNVIWIKSV